MDNFWLRFVTQFVWNVILIEQTLHKYLNLVCKLQNAILQFKLFDLLWKCVISSTVCALKKT